MSAVCECGAALPPRAIREGSGERRQEGIVDPQSLCSLAAGEVGPWRGLALDHDHLPECLGPVVHGGTRRFPVATLASETHRPPSGRAAVDVYWWINGGRVALVDVHLTTPSDAGPLFVELGSPEITFQYPDEVRRAWGLRAPAGGSLEEAIYASRGLSLVLARDASGHATVLRLRGFASMPAKRYVGDYLRPASESFD